LTHLFPPNLQFRTPTQYQIRVETTIQLDRMTSPTTSKEISDGSITTKGSTLKADAKPAASKLASLSVSNQKRMMDETTLFEGEDENLLARRAYNRECAARARKRVKDTIAHLENQVKELQDDKDELRRSIVTMQKQIEALENQNRELSQQSQIMALGRGLPAASNRNVGERGIVLPSYSDLLLLQRSQALDRAQFNGFKLGGQNNFY
jgi:FtsZ-binding cell division protein ZapB